ncbi:MAG: hypothetical protein A2V66_06935 [Ignavibacteria bacterium RBG_13_36_8]|nr:MAG: hypothetical protein A2V66_06935 [Ignavibacteria bacterium RBG_13_36_8]
MSLLVLSYPEIEKKDYDWIQSIRESHDERYYKVVEPHFTIVFPTFNIDKNIFINHIISKTKKIKPFYFVLRCAMIVKDSFSDYTDVFLIPEEGFRIFIKLHDLLYTGPLTKELRLNIPFIPHLGVANNKDAKKCKKLADKLNGQKIEIAGSINSLDIVWHEGENTNTLKKIFYNP